MPRRGTAHLRYLLQPARQPSAPHAQSGKPAQQPAKPPAQADSGNAGDGGGDGGGGGANATQSHVSGDVGDVFDALLHKPSDKPAEPAAEQQTAEQPKDGQGQPAQKQRMVLRDGQWVPKDGSQPVADSAPEVLNSRSESSATAIQDGARQTASGNPQEPVNISTSDSANLLGDSDPRSAVRNRARELFSGRTYQSADGDSILVPWQGIRHGTSGVRGTDSLAAMLHLDDLIESSRRVATQPDREGRASIKAVHQYDAPVVLDGEPKTASIFVREHADGHRYYDHVVLGKNEPSGMPGGAAREGRWPVQPAEGSGATIPPATEAGANPHGVTWDKNARTITVGMRGSAPRIFGAKFENDAREYYEGLKASDSPEQSTQEWEKSLRDRTRAAMEQPSGPDAAYAAAGEAARIQRQQEHDAGIRQNLQTARASAQQAIGDGLDRDGSLRQRVADIDKWLAENPPHNDGTRAQLAAGDSAGGTIEQPDRSAPNEPAGRSDSGVPAGLPVKQTDATASLARKLNGWLASLGTTQRVRFREVSRDVLPDALGRALDAFERFTGKSVHVVRNLTPDVENFNGITFRDGHLYVDERAENPVTTTAAHEFTHQLRQDRPDLYNALADEVRRQGRMDKWQQELSRRSRGESTHLDAATEELTGNAVGDALSDPDFLNRMADKAREERGAAPLETSKATSKEDRVQNAHDTLAADPYAGHRLVDRILDDGHIPPSGRDRSAEPASVARRQCARCGGRARGVKPESSAGAGWIHTRVFCCIATLTARRAVVRWTPVATQDVGVSAGG